MRFWYQFSFAVRPNVQKSGIANRPSKNYFDRCWNHCFTILLGAHLEAMIAQCCLTMVGRSLRCPLFPVASQMDRQDSAKQTDISTFWDSKNKPSARPHTAFLRHLGASGGIWRQLGAWASQGPGEPLRKSRSQKYCVLQCVSSRLNISLQSGEGRKHTVPKFYNRKWCGDLRQTPMDILFLSARTPTAKLFGGK